MAIYRTAQGRKLDMAQLAAKNERTRAVGNMNVNARGDTIDSNGNVIVPVTKKVGKRYSNTVKPESNRAVPVVRKKAEADVVPVVATPHGDQITPPIQSTPPSFSSPSVESAFEEMSDEDLEFLAPTEEDFEIEKIKAEEIKKAQSKKK